MRINLLSTLLMAIAAEAAEVALSNKHNEAGSYHKTFMDGTSYVVQDFVVEGDVEFYGAAGDTKQEEDTEIREEDDAIEALGSIYDLFENSKAAHYIENYDDVLFDTIATHDVNSDHRDLLINLPHVHCDCQSSEQKYFNVEIKIAPSQDARLNRCRARQQRRLGNFINRMLLDLGVGNAGVGDSVVFVAKVCTTPTTSRRLLFDDSLEMDDVDLIEEENVEDLDNERDLIEMKSSGFTYIGGGPCRGCPGDNRDHRRKLQTNIKISCVGAGQSCKMEAWEKVCDSSGSCSMIQSFCSANGSTRGGG